MTTAPAFLPDPSQSLLLQACLLPDMQAHTAFRRWRESVDLDTLDGGSVRLLPLLASRLKALAIDDCQFGKYRGIQRLAWAQNNLLFAKLNVALAALAPVARPVLLKGIALASSVYPQMSTRLMGDLDVLVPLERAPAAMNALLDAGWQPLADIPRERADFAVQHALPFRSPDAANPADLDLHWRLFHWRASPDGDAALHANAVASDSFGSNAATLCPSDMLLHVLGHGASFNGLPPIRWVADATMILRRGGVDWDDFLRQCERFGLKRAATGTLGYLTAEGYADIPDSVFAALRVLPSAPIDDITFAMDQLPFNRRKLVPVARIHLHRARTIVGTSPLSLWRYSRSMRRGRSLGATLQALVERMRQRFR